MPDTNQEILEQIKRIEYLKGKLDASMQHFTTLKRITGLGPDTLSPTELRSFNQLAADMEKDLKDIEREIWDLLPQDLDLLFLQVDSRQDDRKELLYGLVSRKTQLYPSDTSKSDKNVPGGMPGRLALDMNRVRRELRSSLSK